MAGRIRSIKPEILEDEKTAALSHLAWRLFVSLWLIADDYGNLRGDPVYVLGQTLWATAETRETIAAALDELAGSGLLVRYVVRGQGYYHITGWAKHQKVDKPGKPRMPGPSESDSLSSQHVASIPEILEESSRESRETLAPDRDRDLRPGPPTEFLSPSARTIPPAVPQPEHRPVPAVSPLSPAREDIAGTKYARGGVAESSTGEAVCDRSVGQITRNTTENMRGRGTLTAPAATPGPNLAYDPADAFARGRLAESTWRRVSDAAIALAAELELPSPLPFPAITPGSHRRGFAELSARIREEGALAPAACDRVVENAVKQARAKRSIDWLAERLFGDKAWGNARDGIDPSARPPAPRRGDPPPPAPPPVRRPEPKRPDPVLTDEDRAAIEELRARVAANPETAAAALARKPAGAG